MNFDLKVGLTDLKLRMIGVDTILIVYLTLFDRHHSGRKILANASNSSPDDLLAVASLSNRLTVLSYSSLLLKSADLISQPGDPLIWF